MQRGISINEQSLEMHDAAWILNGFPVPEQVM
jgi:hypothetical protein